MLIMIAVKTKTCDKTRRQVKYLGDYIDEDLGIMLNKVSCEFAYGGEPSYDVSTIEDFKIQLYENADSELFSNLKKPIDVMGDIYLFINYPVETPAVFKCSPQKLSYLQLLYLYSKAYQMMYKLEDADCGTTGFIPGMINRAASNGRYGISMHHIGNLTYNGTATIEYYKKATIIELDCDS